MKITTMKTVVGILTLSAFLSCPTPCSATMALFSPGQAWGSGSDGAFNPTQSVQIDLSQAVTGAWDRDNTSNSGKGVYDPNKWAVVFKFSSVNIPPDVTITFKNNPTHAPVVWLVAGDVNVAGTIDIEGQVGDPSGQMAEPGPGGFYGGVGNRTGLVPSAGLGPGGGALPTVGDWGHGSYANTTTAFSGSPYGNDQIVPLIGGSGGAANTCCADTPGAGGGAILIACTGTLNLGGTISAYGGEQEYVGSYAGAGSGGAVRLVADTLSGSGSIFSTNKPTYRSVGNYGRIRLEASHGALTGNIVGSKTTASPGVPYPLIWPPADNPALTLTNIGSDSAPSDPHSIVDGSGRYTSTVAGQSVLIGIAATNVPAAWSMTLRLVPPGGADVRAPCTRVSGDDLSSTWSASITVPLGISRIQVRASGPAAQFTDAISREYLLLGSTPSILTDAVSRQVTLRNVLAPTAATYPDAISRQVTLRNVLAPTAATYPDAISRQVTLRNVLAPTAATYPDAISRQVTLRNVLAPTAATYPDAISRQVILRNPPPPIRVSLGGNDANDGTTWALAKRTVQAGITAAATNGAEVWVAAGTYAEHVALASGVGLYGGFAGTETARDQRNWVANVTTLDGENSHRVIEVAAAASPSTVVDGFSIVRGYAANGNGPGILCHSNSQPVIQNNSIASNVCTGNGSGTGGGYGGGVFCDYASSPSIRENLIVGNIAEYGAGIQVWGDNTLIVNNTIQSNIAMNGGAGVAVFFGTGGTIVANVIQGNQAGHYGGGLYVDAESPRISDNVFFNNAQTDGSDGLGGGGIVAWNCASPVTNNTFVGNTAVFGGGAVHLYSGSTCVLANNILAFNGSGIDTTAQQTYGPANPSLRNNCVFNNSDHNYSGLTDPTGSGGNISTDPIFVDRANGDLHLQTTSPCIDAGDSSVVQPGELDIDGRDRILGSAVDIGAYEAIPSGANLPPQTVITSTSAQGGVACSEPVTITWSGQDDISPPSALVFSWRLDGGLWSPDTPATSVLLTGMADGPHTFEVRATDPDGLTDPTPAVEAFTLNRTAPVPSGIAAMPSLTQASITWSTDRAATTQVEYGLTTAYGNVTGLNTALVTNHGATITGLIVNSTYHYRVHSADACGHDGVSLDRTFVTNPDVTPPDTYIVSGPTEGGTVCSGAVTFAFSGSDEITIAANLVFSYQVDAGAWSAYAGTPTATLTGLTGGPHSFEVKARDEAGNEDPTPAVRRFNVSLTGPIISNVTSAPIVVLSVIRWTTNVPATSQVEYGPTVSYGSLTPVDNSFVTSHSVTVKGLIANTTYHYRVYSTDACGNPSISPDSAFTTPKDTTPPDTQITGGPAEGTTACALPVSFSWTGSDDVTSVSNIVYSYRVDAGNWTAYASDTMTDVGGLTEGQHTFYVKSRDHAGNEDPTPATRDFNVYLTIQSVSNTTATPAAGTCTVTWMTSHPANSTVEYGLTSSYGSSTPVDGNLVTSHFVTITGLAASTGYHFRVRSTDACGREQISPDAQFVTLADHSAPQTSVTSGPADNGKACSATVTFCWTGADDVTPTAQLQYAYQMDSTGWSDWAADTCHTFTGLSEGLHSFQVRSRDVAGNIEVNPVTHYFFVDLTAPTLSNIVTSPRDYRATITWNTSEPTTAQVDYGATTAYGSSTAFDAHMAGSHALVLSNLTPLTLYHFRVRSSDGCQEIPSPDRMFTTTDILKPNFTVTGIQVSATDVKPLDNLNVAWQVENLGPGDASSTWTDSVYISSSNVLDGTATLLGKFNASNELPELGSYSLTEAIQMPPMLAGAYYIIVKADGDNTIAETNENDNTFAVPVNYLKVSAFLATPDQIPASLNVGVPVTGQIQLVDLRSTSLTGITATIEGAASNISVQVSVPSTISSLGVGTANYTLTAADESVTQNAPVIHFHSAEGEDAFVTLNLTVIPRRPQLVLAPGTLTTGMLRGAQTLVECQITNTGAVAATGLQVLTPSVPWMALSTPQALGDLAPGAYARVVVTLMPDVNLPLGLYSGTIAVSGSNTSVQIPFSLTCISNAKGDVKFTAKDEFTYFADTHPNVSGAHVVLTDPLSNAIALEGDTDSTGLLLGTGIAEGTYNAQVTADGHGTYLSTIKIVAGQQQNVNAFMPRQLVTYQWTVVPVDTPDQYVVQLQAVFETHVPAPVVTIEPASLDVSKLGYDASGNAVVNYTITNHGLIAANNVNFTFQDHSVYQMTPATTELGTLPALTSVVVPVTVTRRAKTARDGSGPCDFGGGATYEYTCDVPRTNTATTNVDAGCAGGGTPAPPSPPVSGGGGGGGGTGGDGGGGGPTVYNPPPVVGQPQGCGPCWPLIVALIGCLTNLDPTNIVSCGWSFGVWAYCEVTSPAPQDNLECIIDMLSLLGCWNKPWSGLMCFISVQRALNSCENANTELRGKRTAFVDPDLARFNTAVQRLTIGLDAIAEVFGDPKWVYSAPGNPDSYGAWLVAFQSAVNPLGDAGTRISPNEEISLLNLGLPEALTTADVEKLISRWNRTIDYWSAGIDNAGEVPSGQSTDFIALDQLKSKVQSAAQAESECQTEGYASIPDAVRQCADAFITQQLASADGVCSRVTIRLDQNVTITRTALKATLELSNAPQNVQLQNLGVTLDVRDSLGQNAGTLFGVGAPVVTGTSGFDGTGTVAPGTTATAQWTILPTRDAAPLADTIYTVGGTLSYTQNGTVITIPLFPTRIRVKPDPLLQFHYFWQHDVYSDDPFTPEIEPPEPFSLGLLVDNKGQGTAHNLRIASSQPRIIDNEKGLLVDFKIVGSQVNGQDITPSLTVNLGDVSPNGTSTDTATATWLLTSSLAGKFIDYNAAFQHVDDLSNPRTSLIDSVDIHELEHVVRVVDPTDDGKPDFLVSDVTDVDNSPHTLWISDGTTAPVTSILNPALSGSLNYATLQLQLTLPSSPSGFLYVRAEDPGQADFRLVRVVRSDGREIRFNDNAWSTQRTIHPVGGSPYKQYRLYLFDKETTGSYTLYYQPTHLAPSPVMTGITPDWARINSPGFTLQVAGSNFLVGSTVNWDADALATQFISPTQLFATVPSTRLTKAGPVAITVWTPPAAGGKQSTALTFLVGVSKNFGDANGDGAVTMADAVLLLRVTGGLANVTDISAGDVAPDPSNNPRGYGDGVIDLRDVLTVLRIAQSVGRG